jgi:hypothetical protein
MIYKHSLSILTFLHCTKVRVFVQKYDSEEQKQLKLKLYTETEACSFVIDETEEVQ